MCLWVGGWVGVVCGCGCGVSACVGGGWCVCEGVVCVGVVCMCGVCAVDMCGVGGVCDGYSLYINKYIYV